MKTNILMSLVRNKELQVPYSDCAYTDLDSLAYLEYREFLTNSRRDYDRSECMSYYFYTELIRMCGSSDICENFVYPADEDFLFKCPLRCEKKSYDLQLSYANFNLGVNDSDNQASFRVNYSELNEAALKVTLRFDDLVYMLEEKTAKASFQDLVANFGGTLGCFLGASLLTLIELGNLAFEIADLIVHRKVVYTE
jgi:hypothetical protein